MVHNVACSHDSETESTKGSDYGNVDLPFDLKKSRSHGLYVVCLMECYSWVKLNVNTESRCDNVAFVKMYHCTTSKEVHNWIIMR